LFRDQIFFAVLVKASIAANNLDSCVEEKHTFKLLHSLYKQKCNTEQLKFILSHQTMSVCSAVTGCYITPSLLIWQSISGKPPLSDYYTELF